MSDERFNKDLCGWLGADEIQRKHAAEFGRLKSVAPMLFADAAPTEPVLLYKAYAQALGQFPNYPAQRIGDCVGFGHGHAHDLLQCVEIGLGQPLVYQETDTEFIYAASREVAGILSNTDGSYGSAAVKAMTTLGMVSRPMLGPEGTYSGARAKAWGDSGVPPAILSEASPYLLGGAAAVTTWDELVTALSSGYPTTVCCDQGFTMTRDPQGFCERKGRWGHCMAFVAVRFDRPGACVLQSWGPDVPDGPVALGQPDWSFWIDQATVEAMLAEGDSWAISKTPGFEKRQLPPAWRYDEAA